MATILAVCAVLLLVAAIAFLSGSVRVQWQADQQRARVARKVRLAEWQLQRQMQSAMQRLLDEARSDRGNG